MSSLIANAKTAQLAKLCLKHNTIAITAVRNHWNKDYLADDYPKTKQDREKAAKKYDLHPAEYDVYRDDGTGWGDYPKLPLVSVDSKDPFYPYDFPELKRNFNEPMHVDFDLIREDRYDVSARLRMPIWGYFVRFFGVMGSLFIVYYYCQRIKCFHKAVPKQYPKDGPHYTFDLINKK